MAPPFFFAPLQRCRTKTRLARSKRGDFELDMSKQTRFAPLVVTALAFALGACEGIKTTPPDTLQTHEERNKTNYGKLFGDDALSFNFGADRESDNGQAAGIGVNGFLWRASLDTMSFLPLASADPFGGVIISDWYAPPESPDERFKITVYILGTQLRSDGIRAAVFRQEKQQDDWLDAAVTQDTSVQLENAILTRARQLRVAALQ